MKRQALGDDALGALKDALKETLEARGSLGQIKARIRAEIFAALDEEETPKPRLSNENLVINELIREYFEYNGYRHACSVFLAESGQPSPPPFPREFLASELRVTEDPRFAAVPLLYGITTALQQQVRSDTATARSFPIQDERRESRLSHTSVQDAPSIGNPDTNIDPTDTGAGNEQPSPLIFQK